jgi:hypothetical protein
MAQIRGALSGGGFEMQGLDWRRQGMESRRNGIAAPSRVLQG